MTTATKTKAAQYTLDKSTIESACSLLAPVVPKRSPKPILQNVRLGEGLVVANDLEIQVAIELPDYDGPTLLLPHGRLSAILKESGGDEVTLIPGDTKCVVKCGRGQWTLPTEDPAEFPVSEPTGLKPVARLTPEQFRQAIHGVTYAADNESSRYALSAVLIEVQDGVVSFVATDGRRLSLSTVETDQAVDDSATLLPDRAAVLASRFIGGEDSVQIEASTSEAVITHGGVTVIARLIQGRFPRWRDVIPADRTVAVTKVARSDLVAATRLAAIVTSEQSKGVDFKFSAKCITLSARSSESGESRVECEVLEAGHTTSVKLDPRYVVDWLRGLPGDASPEVSISALDKGDAVVLSCEWFTGVVMPLDPSAE
jgi:DNA polymerase III subunit beta